MQTKSKGGINLEFEIATLHQLIKNDVDKILPHLSSKVCLTHKNFSHHKRSTFKISLLS